MRDPRTNLLAILLYGNNNGNCESLTMERFMENYREEKECKNPE